MNLTSSESLHARVHAASHRGRALPRRVIAPVIAPVIALGLALVTLGSPLGALPQEPPPGVESRFEAETARESARERDRFLHLENGSILRVRSRLLEGRWEVRRGSEWVPLPPDSVRRAHPESVVEAENRRRLGKLSKAPAPERVAHVGWMLQEGLFAEGLKELDSLLEADPDQPQALALLAASELPVALPDLRVPFEHRSAATQSFLARAARTGPAVQALAVSRLERDTNPDALLEDLRRSLLSPDPDQRAFTALCLRRLHPGEEVRPLLARAVLDRSTKVRAEAGRALRDARDPEILAPVLGALESEHSAVRYQAAELLGVLSAPASVGPLVTALNQASGSASPAPGGYIFVGNQRAYVSDFDVEVAQNESIANPQINVLLEGSMLEARAIAATTYTTAQHRSAIRHSLERITGEDPGSTTRAWNKWWETKGPEWVKEAEAKAASPAAQTAGGPH